MIDSPLKWHGGKHYLAKKIVALMPPTTQYVEPYAGGLSVLLERPEPYGAEIVNDKSRHLTNFWRVLQHEYMFEKFMRIMNNTPFSEDEFRCANSIVNDIGWDGLEEGNSEGMLMRACSFFINCRQSLAGRMKSFATLTKNRVRRGMNEQASAWLTAIEGLQEVHERLRGVVILNRDALDVIWQQDTDNTVFYLDPPYMAETRKSRSVYEHEMSRPDHDALIATLSNIKGKFLLSGYHSDLYDKAAAECCWDCHEFELPNNAAGGEEKRVMTECVWTNF